MTGAAERREAAATAYRESVEDGQPLTPRELGERFDRSRTWGRQVITATVAATNGNGSDPTTKVPAGNNDPTGNLSDAESAPAAWQRRVTGAAVLLVALVAAVISYSHMRDLALSAGEGRWQAALIPLSVDGMMVAASMTALVRKRTGQSVGVLPWAALLLGVAASVAANIASAEPTLTGRAIAAWPPIALLVSLEMLLRQTRETAR